MSRIIVGRLGAAFGIKGWQKCQSFTQPATNLFDYQPWQINIKGDWIVTEYEAYKSHGDGFVVKVPQADEREAARHLANCEIAVDRSQLPELPADTYYWTDLQGLTVVTENGEVLGKIENMLETGANDVMIINAGDKQHAIPFLQGHVVKHVDLVNKTVTVDWELLT